MIKATIKGQSLKISYPTIVSDTIDYLAAEFEFKTADWDGLEKWAHFRRGNAVIDIKLTDDKILQSDSLNLSSGVWELKVHGNVFEGGKVKQRITTEPQQIYVKKFGELDGEPFPDSPPTAIEGIYAEIEELKKNGGGSTSSARISEVSLISSGWIGERSPYAQTVNIDGVTANSQVDLTPSVEQLAIFYEKDLAFVTENDDGVVTVYAIGQKPANDYTIQVTITEVIV